MWARQSQEHVPERFCSVGEEGMIERLGIRQTTWTTAGVGREMAACLKSLWMQMAREG